MRGLLLFLPVFLWAQTPPPKPAAAKPKPPASKPAAAKPPARKTGTANPKPAPGPALTTDDQKTIYSLGLSIHRSLSQFDLSAAELEIIKRALSDASASKPAVDIKEWGPKIEALARTRAGRAADREKAVSAAYLTKVAGEPGAVKTDS